MLQVELPAAALQQTRKAQIISRCCSSLACADVRWHDRRGTSQQRCATLIFTGIRRLADVRGHPLPRSEALARPLSQPHLDSGTRVPLACTAVPSTLIALVGPPALFAVQLVAWQPSRAEIWACSALFCSTRRMWPVWRAVPESSFCTAIARADGCVSQLALLCSLHMICRSPKWVGPAGFGDRVRQGYVVRVCACSLTPFLYYSFRNE